MEKSNIIRHFREFGTKMYVLAILSIISIFTSGIVQLAAFIIMLISLKHIKDANRELNNENLEKFRSNIIYSVIIGITGGAILLIVGIIIFTIIVQLMPMFPITTPPIINIDLFAPLLIIIVVIVLVALAIAIISLNLLIRAWGSLSVFFKDNPQSLAPQIASRAMEGADKLKKAYLLEFITLLLGFFIGIVVLIISPLLVDLFSIIMGGGSPPIGLIVLIGVLLGLPGVTMGILGIISFIYMIIGYFRLSDLKNL